MKRNSFYVLTQQIERNCQEHQIFHEEGNVFGHCWKSASRGFPAVWEEWDDRERRDKRKTGTKRTKNSCFLVPKAPEQECTKQPFGNSQEPSGGADTEHRIHPEDQRAMAYVRDQPLGLILKPLLITEEQKDDHHRGAGEMVIKIFLEDTQPNQNACDQIHRAVLWSVSVFASDALTRACDVPKLPIHLCSNSNS